MQIKAKLKSESTLFLLLLIGILFFVNLISLRFFARLDLTRDNIFTLSKASTKLVEKLEDKLVVKAYFTANLPGEYANLERHVRDVLDEYEQHSNGKMSVEFIDPAGNEEEEKIANGLGIHKMPNPDIERDQATVKEGYRGIAISYGQNTEAIPAVESATGLEYEITSTLKKVMGRKSRIGFLTGHGEPEIEPPQQDPSQQMMSQGDRGAFRNVRGNLDTYDYVQVNLENGEKEIDKEIDGLVIAGSKEKFNDKELYIIDQFLMNGGSLAFFVDGVVVDVQAPQFQGLPPNYMTSVNDPGLRALLEHYGINLGRDIVMDLQAADMPAMCPPIPLPLPRPYPAWPIVTAFGKEHPLTYRLGSLTIPYPTTVRISKEALSDPKREAREIAFSTGNSWTVAGTGADVNPCSIGSSNKLESGIPMAAAIQGKFESFFKGKQNPLSSQKGEIGKDAPDGSGAVSESVAPGRIAVVGSSGTAMDETLVMLMRMDRRQALNNFIFMQNILDWMTNDEDLIAVRMKNVDDPPLDKASEGTKAMAKYGNIAGIPLLFVAFGLIRWRIRAKRREKSLPKTDG